MRGVGLSLFSLAALLVGCGGIPHIVPLIRTAGPPVTPTPSNATPLEVVSRSTAVPDPLPVRGSDIVYGELESALGIALSTAAVPWADAHRDWRGQLTRETLETLLAYGRVET